MLGAGKGDIKLIGITLRRLIDMCRRSVVLPDDILLRTIVRPRLVVILMRHSEHYAGVE
jgi:hypothetical protein